MAPSETTTRERQRESFVILTNVANILPRDSTSNSRSASAPSNPRLLRAPGENFFRPFLPSPREKQSLSLQEIQFSPTIAALFLQRE